MNSPGCKIEAVSVQLPEQLLTNEELEQEFPDFKAAKIEKKIGVKSRHVVTSGETALDLAEKAAKRLLTECPQAAETDFLLYCTQSPDYFLPPGACILQKRLGLKNEIGALDYNLGCSGFIYGLALAQGLIRGGIARKVLLLTAETYSKHLRRDDKSDRSIFGDGAAATLIGASEQEHFGHFVLGTDGRGAENLIVKNGAFRNPSDGSEGDFLYMNGPEIFNFTIETIPTLVEKVLQRNSIGLQEVDHFVFHQANKYMLNYLGMKIGIPAERFHIDMEDTGNTVSASIPILLNKLLQKGIIHSGDRLLLAGFGVGYSYGGVSLTW